MIATTLVVFAILRAGRSAMRARRATLGGMLVRSGAVTR